MSSQRRINLLMAKYPVFRLLFISATDPYRANLPRRNAFLVVAMGLLLLLCSWLDDTLLLPGPANGMLESPDIFGFLIASILLPFLARRSLSNFATLTTREKTILSPEKFAPDLLELRKVFYLAVSRDSRWAKAGFRILASIGFLLFAWNTLQNQSPLYYVGFEGWDTFNHPFGYWGTRVYKIYLWLLLMPAVVHIELLFVWYTRALLLRADKKAAFLIDPYHPDGCGGVLIFVNSVLNPLVPIVFTASMLTVATVLVHGQFNVTTIGGMLWTCLLFLILYIIPATALRNAIDSEKNRRLQEIGNLQNRLYSAVVEHDRPGPSVKESLDLISSLGAICQQIREIPNWPQLKLVVKVISLASSPSLIGIAAKLAPPLVSKLVGVP